MLFPLILSGGSPLVRFPIARMMAEHADVEEQLVRLRTLTHDFASPPGVCERWRALGVRVREADPDGQVHPAAL